MWYVTDTKFTWVIKNFTSLQSKFVHSDEFVLGGCNWCLMAFPKGEKGVKCLSLYLMVGTLPCGWKRHAKYSLTVVNQLSEKLSQRRGEREVCFEQMGSASGYSEMIPLTKLDDKDGGFLVNNQVKIVAEVEVLEVIGKSDVLLEETTEQVVNQPLEKIKLNDDGHCLASIDVNGFQVLPSQAESVKRIFGKHPEIASECRTKKQDLRTSYMNVVLNLIKMLFISPKDALTDDDLFDAEAAIAYMKSVGFKLDWLEKRLDQIKEMKRKCDRVFEMKQQSHELKQKCKDQETQINKENLEILEAADFC